MSRKFPKITDSQGRLVCDLEFERFGSYDEGSYVSAATYVLCPTKWTHRVWYKITGKICRCPAPVPDDELEHLTDSYPEFCDEATLDSAIDAAEAWADAARGH